MKHQAAINRGRAERLELHGSKEKLKCLAQVRIVFKSEMKEHF